MSGYQYRSADMATCGEQRAPLTSNDCERCEGDGSYSELAPCTTFGTDCACNGPRVVVDPCPACHGTGQETA